MPPTPASIRPSIAERHRRIARLPAIPRHKKASVPVLALSVGQTDTEAEKMSGIRPD